MTYLEASCQSPITVETELTRKCSTDPVLAKNRNPLTNSSTVSVAEEKESWESLGVEGGRAGRLMNKYTAVQK